MLNIKDNHALRSICNEAGRQTDYYTRRGQDSLAQVWSEIESMAFTASRERRSLLITTGNDSSTPNPIKGCE